MEVLERKLHKVDQPASFSPLCSCSGEELPDHTNANKIKAHTNTHTDHTNTNKDTARSQYEYGAEAA